MDANKDKPITRVDKLLTKRKKNKLLGILTILALGAIAIGAFTDAPKTILNYASSFLKSKKHINNTCPLKSAQDALIEILGLTNSSPEIHKAIWIEQPQNSRKPNTIFV